MPYKSQILTEPACRKLPAPPRSANGEVARFTYHVIPQVGPNPRCYLRYRNHGEHTLATDIVLHDGAKLRNGVHIECDMQNSAMREPEGEDPPPILAHG